MNACNPPCTNCACRAWPSPSTCACKKRPAISSATLEFLELILQDELLVRSSGRSTAA